MPVLDLNPQTRSALRAAAHPLKPVVLIGDKGLSDAVLLEIDRNLNAHGLIKVRAGGDDRATRDVLLHDICEALSCAPVHHLGKVLILFRPLDESGNADTFLAARQAAGGAPATQGGRKPNEPYVSKKQAAAGKTEPAPQRRAEPKERAERTLTARERYLGIPDKPVRPSLHKETGSRRGAARVEEPRRSATGLKSTLGAARPRPAAGSRSAGGPARTGSALTLRAGARSGQRTTATSRKPKSATKK